MPAQVLALIGPTASGKTELAIELSKEYPCEVISLDSALVYCGMDIGTAKPSQEIRNQLPHHLVDIISPLENYNAARFVTDCTRLIQEISQRGRLALILGGSMMYYHALIYGLNKLPPANAVLRQQLAEKKRIIGLSGLYQELLKIDPFTAKRLPASDTQRIERALEVYYLTGKPISTLRLMPTKSSCNWPTLALVPMQKAQLHPIIAQRFHRMLREGVIDEVKQLKSCYPTLNLDYPSLRCVGYRQIWQYLSGELSKNVMIDKAIIATCQLAKRQLTWLRKITIDEILRPDDLKRNLQRLICRLEK